MNYTIRPVNTSDHDVIYSLFCQSVRPYVEPVWGWDASYQRIDFEKSLLFSQYMVIEVEGKFSGFVQICAQKDVLELCEIHLLPGFRGRGIGSAVIKGMFAEATVVRTGCFKSNAGAMALYQRLGFRQIGETSTHILLEHHA